MNTKVIKRMWKAFKTIIVYTFVFWISETTFFIIRDGFHLKSETRAETICDYIVFSGYLVSLCIFFSVVYEIINNTLKDS
jgi:hypothetical protein